MHTQFRQIFSRTVSDKHASGNAASSAFPEKARKARASGLWFRAAAACLLLAIGMVCTGRVCAHGTGDLIRVFTVRNYFYYDPHHEMNIDVPNLRDPKHSQGAEQINKEVDAFTENLAEAFHQEQEALGDKGYGAIFVEYDVLRNDETWFTLRLTVNRIAGSSDSYYQLYNLDRRTGKLVTFSDLFCSSESPDIIRQDILKQMQQRMAQDDALVYFTGEENPWELSKDQNFYFDEDGRLIIPFDKYVVSPGSMGTPEFAIDPKVLSGVLKPEYQELLSQ